MTDYSKFSEDELFSEMDLITSELEARLEMDRKEAEEAEENERLLYKAMGWKMPAKRKTAVSDMDKRKLYWLEHDVRLDGVCISTWWSPEDSHKLLDIVYEDGSKEVSAFCDDIDFPEFCLMLDGLL